MATILRRSGSNADRFAISAPQTPRERQTISSGAKRQGNLSKAPIYYTSTVC
ncbi:MAG: hypothetical protein NXH85_18780 [Pseudomonadaceae bacterium]|nr:hypothetical protein [Pseudomonadaceae bacterium]